MRYDSRLPRVLHVLLHLDRMEEPATSDLMSRMLGTNSAVVRRTMAGLREKGYLHSVKGHGGGWTLAKPLSEITLLGLYEALGSPTLFALGNANDAPTCLMEQAANDATDTALEAAGIRFREALASITMADLADDFEARLARRSGSDRPPPEGHHACRSADSAD
ncbi:Rrf2 family transcriptional regulator [Consotaella aegiceratis]|uniref:Rrf2 family transcriptional regulator n=1 Tax=Consotaella aegiceratis TaxID=3097961 RepID=UPI002F41780B